METYLNDEESRLFDLIEAKDWEELTEEEQLFVLQQTTQEEYVLHRQIMLEASEELYFDEVDPLPLTMPSQPKPFIRRSIPLYQAIAAIAATILFFILIRPAAHPAPEQITQPQPMASQSVKEKEYIYDTIVKYVTLTTNAESIILDTFRQAVAFPVEEKEPKLLEAAANLPIPELTSEKLNTKGSSLKEENTMHLVPKIVNTIY